MAPVRAGDAVATLVVDVTKHQNVLHVSAVNDPDMNRLLTSLATRVSAPMDRTFETKRVAPLQHSRRRAVDGLPAQRPVDRDRVPDRHRLGSRQPPAEDGRGWS